MSSFQYSGKKGSDDAFAMRVASILGRMAPSPIKSLIAALVVQADATLQFDILSRVYLLEGLLNLPPSGQKSLRQLSKHPRAEGLPPEIFDHRTNTGMYKTFTNTVRRSIHNPQRAEEAAQNIFIGITPGRGKKVDPLFYTVGRSVREKDGTSPVTLPGLKGAVVRFTVNKARDHGKLKRSPIDGAMGFDSPIGDESKSTLADLLADSTDYTLLQSVFDTPEGYDILRRLADTISAALASDGQRMVWEAILDHPSLIGHKSDSVAGMELSEILAERGYDITRQRAGILWRKVLDTVRQVAVDNPNILAKLEDRRLIQQMLDPRSIGKLAAAISMADIEKYNRMVDDNLHGGALVFMAKKIGLRRTAEILNKINDLHETIGHLPTSLSTLRTFYANEVYDAAKRTRVSGSTHSLYDLMD